jgi:hypothetical protein
MAISVRCSICGEEYALGESLAGKKVCCQHCHATIAVPASAHGNAVPDQRVVPASSRFQLKWIIGVGLVAGLLIIGLDIGGWFIRPVGPPLPPKKVIEVPISKKSADPVPLKGPLNATIKGQGIPPPAKINEYMEKDKDRKECFAGRHNEKIDQTWLFGKDGGVANVVVSLQPPKGFRFHLTPSVTKRSDVIVMETPHCAFVPHVAVLFPEFVDESGKRIRTGQVFRIRNSGSLLHNAKWRSEKPYGQTINTGSLPGNERTITLNPQEEPIQFGCNIHPWMSAFVWAFDHPYAAVTKEDGSFEISNALSGVELQVIVWHEAGPTIRDSDGAFWQNSEKSLTFKKGMNVLDLKVTANK